MINDRRQISSEFKNKKLFLIIVWRHETKVYQGHLKTVVFATRRKWNKSKMLSINPNQIEENEKKNMFLYLCANKWDRLLEARRKKASHKSIILSYKSDLI